LIFILIVVLIIVNCITFGSSRSFDNSNHWLYRELTENAMRNINDSIPAYEYKRIEDSVRNKIVLENSSMISSGAGWAGYSLGTSTNTDAEKEENYLYFSGYKIKNPFTYFFKKDGKMYMTYDSNGIITTKPSQIKYINDRETDTGEVFMPTTHATIKWLNMFHWPLLFILIIIVFGIFVNTPLRVLYNIAKGKAFNDENIGSLHVMAWLLIVFGVLPGLISLVSYLIIREQIPDQIQYRFFHSIMHGWEFIVAGLITLLLAKAFKKGYELQEEQELTV
jgi:hypothetical protein